MRKKHDSEKHSIESVRVFFFANFKYPAQTQYHSDCKHRWTSIFLGRRAIIFRLAEFLKYLSNLPVFFFFVFFFCLFFFHAFNEPKNQTMEEKGEEKQRERRKERRASEYVVTFLHWLYFGNVFKRKKTLRKKLALLA